MKEYIWGIGGVLLARESRSTRKKSSPNERHEFYAEWPGIEASFTR